MCILLVTILVSSPTMLVSTAWQIPSRDFSVTLPVIVLVVNNILAPVSVPIIFKFRGLAYDFIPLKIVFNPWLWNFSTDL